MATDVLVGFWIMTILVASVIRNSATQMLDGYSSIENCDAMCATAFTDSKASYMLQVKCLDHWYLSESLANSSGAANGGPRGLVPHRNDVYIKDKSNAAVNTAAAMGVIY